MPRIPGIRNGDEAAPAPQLPVIELAPAALQIGEQVNPVTGVKRKVILIGPVMLAVPLGDEAARNVVKGLTGVHIAKPGEL